MPEGGSELPKPPLTPEAPKALPQTLPQVIPTNPENHILTVEAAIKQTGVVDIAKKEGDPRELATREVSLAAIEPGSITERIGVHKGVPPSAEDLARVEEMERKALATGLSIPGIQELAEEADNAKPKIIDLTERRQEFAKARESGSALIEKIPGRDDAVYVVDPETGRKTLMHRDRTEYLVARMDQNELEAMKARYTEAQISGFLSRDLASPVVRKGLEVAGSNLNRDLIGFVEALQIERLEQLPPIEKLPSIEQIEKMESFVEVADVLFQWHALADREPSLQWTEENEAILDAAFAKFGEMADDSQYDLSGGKLVGIAKNIKRLRDKLAPANPDDENDPNNQLADEYESKKAEIEELAELIRLRKSVDVHKSIHIEREALKREQEEAYKKSQDSSLSSEERDAAYILHVNKGHALTINERQEKRDPLKKQKDELESEIEEKTEEVTLLQKKIDNLASDGSKSPEDKEKIKDELEKDLKRGQEIVKDRNKKLEGVNNLINPPEEEEKTLEELEAEFDSKEKELKEDPRFEDHHELDKKLEEYGDIMSDVAEGMMVKQGMEALSEVSSAKEEKGEKLSEMPNFNVVMFENEFAQMVKDGADLGEIDYRIQETIIAEAIADPSIARRVVDGRTRAVNHELLEAVMQEDRNKERFDRRRDELEGILQDIDSMGVDAVLERSQQRISKFIEEAKRIDLINEDWKTLDKQFLDLKSELTPRSAGYMTAEVIEPDFFALIQKYDEGSDRYQGANQYADRGFQIEMQNRRWAMMRKRHLAFSAENRTRFDGLIPFLYQRFNMQAADVAAAYSQELATGRTVEGRFPDRLAPRNLAEGEWDIRDAEERLRAERGSKLYKDSGSGYYYVFARTQGELELAAEHFAREKIKSGAVKREPNAIFQEREKFVLAMASAAAEANLDPSVVRRAMSKFEMEIFAYAAEVSNRNNKPELVAQILQVAGEYEDGLERYRLMMELLDGDFAAATFVLDREGGAEIVFRPWGTKNHFGNETHKYLLLHGVTRDLIAQKLIGVDLALESRDEDTLGKGIVYPKGYDAERLRELLPALEAKKSSELTRREREELRMARTQWRIDNSAMTPELIAERAVMTGEIVLTGDAARKRNLEKVGRFQSKEDFKTLYDWEAHKSRYHQLEAMYIRGDAMSTKEITLLKLGRIQKKIDNKEKLTKGESAYWTARVSDKRNAVNLAIQFYSMTQQIAVRGDPSYVCGNGLDAEGRGKRALARLPKIQEKQAEGKPLSAREQDILRVAQIQQLVDSNQQLSSEQRAFYQSNIDIIHRGRGGKDVAVERREAHFVSKRLAKKSITFVDNYTKREWDRKLRIRSIPADVEGEAVVCWADMTPAARVEMLADIKGFYDPLNGLTEEQTKLLLDESDLDKAKNKDQLLKQRKDLRAAIQKNWERLTPEESLRSLLEAKGNRGDGKGGMINQVAPKDPSHASEGDHKETLWDRYDESKRSVEAAKVWRRSQAATWIRLVHGITVDPHWSDHLKPEEKQKLDDSLVKFAFEGGSDEFFRAHALAVDFTNESTRDALEDAMQDIRFRKRKITREKNIKEVEEKGFRAKLLDSNGNEIKIKVGERRPKAEVQPDGSIKIVGYQTVPVEKTVDVMTASQHPFGQFLGITYIAQQNEIRNQILRKEITDQARAVLGGTLRYEDADPLVLLRLEVDPTLRRMQPLGGEIDDPDTNKNLESKMRTMVFAQVHESFFGSDRIEKELRGIFVDPNNVDNRVTWHWTNEHIGSKRVINLAEYIANYMNSLSRRMRSGIKNVSQPVTSMPEMFGVGTMGVMGIPMLINRRSEGEERFLQELLDPPELNAYGGMVGASVKIRDAEITHIDERGMPKEGTREKPTNNADDWRGHAADYIRLFSPDSHSDHLIHENALEKTLRETLGRNEVESRQKVAMLRFFRTAGEEMLVERKAMFSEDNRYIFNVDTDRASPPPVSGSRAFVDDGIYEHFLWLLSEEGRKAYPDAKEFYDQANWGVVVWYRGKVTL